jgi:hypothetical protein
LGLLTAADVTAAAAEEALEAFPPLTYKYYVRIVLLVEMMGQLTALTAVAVEAAAGVATEALAKTAAADYIIS